VSQIERARSFFKNDPKVTLTQQAPINQERFDIVFCNHVIEHVPDEDLDQFMKTLTDLVTPDGLLVIATPNGLNPFSHTYFMASDFTHLRMHSPFTLAEVLELKDFDLVAVHRELPQVYDLQTFAKYWVWLFFSSFAKLAILSHAGGVRGLAYPLTMASTFYGVAKRKKHTLAD